MIRLFKILLATLLLALIGAIAAYIYTISNAKPLDDAARAKAPGAFLETSQGKLHYRWHGPENGPVIVMAHGFSTPNFIFAPNAKALADQGFRVLTFDHFGRGWSDRPKARYTPDFYDRELTELVDGLGITEPFGLVGLSMGGPITAEFTARHPERVSKLFLFVPAGFETSTKTGSAQDILLRTPIIGDWVWRVFGKRLLLASYEEDGAAASPTEGLAGNILEQIEYAGYFEALLSSYRHLPMQDQDEIFARVEASGVPIHAIFGEQDETVLIASADRLEKAAPSAIITRIQEGRHGLNYQLSAEVGPILTGFFDSLKTPAPAP